MGEKEELLMSSKERERVLPATNDTHAHDGKSTPEAIPDLSKSEHEKMETRIALSAVVVHEAVREEGVRELNRSSLALAWSGLAAGLSMGFSLIAKGLFHAYLPIAPWSPLIDNLGYSVGFLIVVLGRQQLFTENTLTVVLPLMRRRDSLMLAQVARLWTTVLAANLVGAALFASAAAQTQIFSPETRDAMA